MSGDKATWGWGCSKCKGEPEGDKLVRLRNCDSDDNPNIAWDWMPGLRRCPWSQITSETWAVFNWWRDWKNLKVLPWGGTDLMEQPAYILEAIDICEGIYKLVESEEHDKHKKEVEHMHSKNAHSGKR